MPCLAVPCRAVPCLVLPFCALPFLAVPFGSVYSWRNCIRSRKKSVLDCSRGNDTKEGWKEEKDGRMEGWKDGRIKRKGRKDGRDEGKEERIGG